jgi:Cytochrome P450
MSELDPIRHIHKMKNLASAFLTSSILKFEETVDEAIMQLSNQIDDHPKPHAVMDLSAWFLYFAFDVVGRMTFSKSFRLLEEGRDIGNSLAIGEFLERYLGVIGHPPLLNSLLMDNPITR